MSFGLTSMFRNGLEVYEYLSRPICQEAGIQQGELRILLFLANHPDKNTAMDVHKCGGMKPSMISTLVEKLVQKDYLERQPVAGDRRKVKLVCTPKAAPVIEAGKEVQKKFMDLALSGASKEDLEAYMRVKALIEENMLECKEKMLKGELE